MTTTQAQAQAQAKAAIIPGKFNGMLANFQVSAYGTMVMFGIGKGVAHKIASDYASDLGNAMRSDDEFAAKVSKAKKDGDSVIRFTGKGSTKMTHAMAVIRVAQSLEALRKEKLIERTTLKAEDFTPDIREYVESCEEWAKEQTWE